MASLACVSGGHKRQIKGHGVASPMCDLKQFGTWATWLLFGVIMWGHTAHISNVRLSWV